MKNAKIKKLEPKEWLDRVIDNLDQLYMLTRPPLAPMDCEFLLLAGQTSEFPSLHVPAETLLELSHELGIRIEHWIVGRMDDGAIHAERYFYYRAHKIYAADFVGSVEEAEKLWS